MLTLLGLVLSPSLAHPNPNCTSHFSKNAERDAELIEAYPETGNYLKKIETTLSDFQRKGYFNGKNQRGQNNLELLLSSIEKDGHTLPARHKDAAVAVAHALLNVEAWKEYAKELYLESAHWVSMKGSKSEKELLKKDGQLTTRALLVALAQRARSRGETPGKITSVLTTAQFADKASRGPFVDMAFDFESMHGWYPHWLQMDYLSPTLQKVYGKEAGEFYRNIILASLWNPLFDRFQDSFASPMGINKVLGTIFPINYF